MSDPLAINPEDLEFYKQSDPPRVSDYTKRTSAELARDVTVCHNNLRKQIHINTKLLAQLEREKVWRKFLIWLVGAQWAVFLIVFKEVLPLVLKGLGK